MPPPPLLEITSSILRIITAPRSLLLIEGEGLFQSPRVHPHALMGALTTLALDFGIPCWSHIGIIGVGDSENSLVELGSLMVSHLTGLAD